MPPLWRSSRKRKYVLSACARASRVPLAVSRSIVLTADTYTSVLTDLLAYAAEATAKLVLAAAARKIKGA
jgi:hypothetical protein